MPDTYFQNKIAVVTGAGGTLCSEIAEDLACKGAEVVLVGRTEEKLRAVADKISASGGCCKIAVCDVTDEAKVEALAEETFKEWGVCDFLINGAGGNNSRVMTTETAYRPCELDGNSPEDYKGFFNLDMEAFESVLQINTLGSVIPIRAFGKQMAKKRGGAIINFASMNSYCPLTKVPAYAMSKAAVVNMTQWLAAYLAPAGIRVNAIAPGFFANERSVKFLGTPETGLSPRGQKVIDHTPMERFGQAKDMLGCVNWLLDDRASSFVTGITVPVDGGFLTRSGV